MYIYSYISFVLRTLDLLSYKYLIFRSEGSPNKTQAYCAVP